MKESGLIVDLTITNKESSSRYYPFNTINEAVDIIKKIYNQSELCLGEMLTSIAINECNIENVITIIAKARKEIDDYDMILLMDKDECYHLAGDENLNFIVNRRR